jgi:hypothetical protein
MEIRATAANLTRSMTVTLPSAVETYAHKRKPGRRNDGRCSRSSCTTPAISRTPSRKNTRKLRGRFIGWMDCYMLSARLATIGKLSQESAHRSQRNAAIVRLATAQFTSRCKTAAICRTSSPSSANSSGRIDCIPSESALSGS